MNLRAYVGLGLLAGAFLLFWEGCTNSPFENEIQPQPRVLRGQVGLDDRQDDKSGVYVWLEGLELSARTDSAGKFQIEIPTTLTATGMYRLFFYVANYGLQFVEVVVRNGLFEYGHAGLNASGDLIAPIRLFKILTITSIVDPPQVPRAYTASIDLQVTFRATGDSVEIIVPKSVGGLLGGIFFRHLQTGKIFIDIPDLGADTRERVLIGNQPLSRRQVFQLNGTNFRELFLPTGDFEVIPYFFIEQKNMPPGLLKSLGDDVEAPTSEYLNIPFRREGGEFEVF